MSGSWPWHLDEAGARHLIDRAATRSTDIFIDYEHQTLLGERNGLPAAADWVAPRSLEWCADDLYGHVQWPDAAKAANNADSYRHLSPVFLYNTDSGAVLNLAKDATDRCRRGLEDQHQCLGYPFAVYRRAGVLYIDSREQACRISAFDRNIISATW